MTTAYTLKSFEKPSSYPYNTTLESILNSTIVSMSMGAMLAHHRGDLLPISHFHNLYVIRYVRRFTLTVSMPTTLTYVFSVNFARSARVDLLILTTTANQLVQCIILYFILSRIRKRSFPWRPGLSLCIMIVCCFCWSHD